VFRNTISEEVHEEIENFVQQAKTYYTCSGEIPRLVGVMRAADIFWNNDR
jgi:hypothetical protein